MLAASWRCGAAVSDAGLRVLILLADGEAHTLQQVADGIGKCKRKTGGAILGCRAAGLVDAQEVTHPARFTITQAGLDALAEYR